MDSYGKIFFLLDFVGLQLPKLRVNFDPDIFHDHVSNEKNLGWLGYTGDYTAQLYPIMWGL